MTAEDLIEATNITFDDWEVIKRLMIDFAKLHVVESKGAIQDVSRNKYYAGETGYLTVKDYEDVYPLNNIK